MKVAAYARVSTSDKGLCDVTAPGDRWIAGVLLFSQVGA